MEQRCIRPLQRRGRHGNPRRRTWTGGAGWQESRGNQWGIYASHAFVERFGRPVSPDDIERFKVIGLVRELETLPAVRWMKAHASRASVAARCANIPSVHLAVKSGAGLAPLPTVYAAEDVDLVNLFGALPELNYPIFLVAHRDMRKHPRVSAFFEFCAREFKPVLLHGTMGQVESLIQKS